MGRILPTVVVLALLGCTAAAFAVTENLKLERSPISDTDVSKVVAPDSPSNDTAAIGFLLRKPDRLTVEIVNGSGNVVRTLARDKAARSSSPGTAATTRTRWSRTPPTGRGSTSRASTARS